MFAGGAKSLGNIDHLSWFTANPMYMFFGGLIMTIIWQSSSLSTTAVVALVAGGALAGPDKLPAVIACLIGCNLGTTFTAHLAAIFSAKEMSNWYQSEGFRVAMIHSGMNVFMAVMLLPFIYPIARLVSRF
tara:strand:- start:45 stop:437 length:393 start_codon:yes stop_codon:yes gene_type:complete